MRNTFLIFLLIFFFSSCARDIIRKRVGAYVYYKQLPVTNAKILTWQGYKNGFIEETKTDSLGRFNLKEMTRYSLGLESRNISQKFLIKKGKLISDTLVTSSINNTHNSIDTVYLKVKK